MKISMIPNKIVKLIHASKGDTSLRKWAFEPYDNNGAINVSNIKDQLVYKTENGGTEQLLPVNTSTPTTSYFDGTINYGTDTDVGFTYKQSSYTGQARIKSIKGNTLVWNQLVQNGNFSSTSNWLNNSTNFSVSGNVATYVPTSNGNRFIYQTMPLTIGHKYLYSATIKASAIPSDPVLTIYYGGTSNVITHSLTSANVFQTFKGVFTCVSNTENTLRLNARDTTITYNAMNVMLFDLTQMGLDVTADQFKSIFPLSYYAYNSGSLLNFNGTGIKTTGQNLCDNSTITVGYYTSQSLIIDNNYRTSDLIPVLPNTTYIGTIFDKEGTEINRLVYTEWDGNGNFISQSISTTITTSNKTAYLRVRNFSAQQSYIDSDNFLYQLEIGYSVSTYEPYTSSTLSLPISTYFPTGMKSAGSGANTKYDEITGGKAITRIGTRAYASGDESDSTVTTDGTNTNYELATYTETDIKTASLVCKNTEVPCYISNGELVCDATEELTNESGFFDAKLKLNDSSSVAYSSKFKLHVEDL